MVMWSVCVSVCESEGIWREGGNQGLAFKYQ
jgi:hypothetical protein